MARKITLKVVNLLLDDDNGNEVEGEEFRYKKVIIMALRVAHEGIAYDRMSPYLDAIDKIRACDDGGDVVLSETEWDVTVAAVKAWRWRINSRTILDFGRHIADAPHYDPNKAT